MEIVQPLQIVRLNEITFNPYSIDIILIERKNVYNGAKSYSGNNERPCRNLKFPCLPHGRLSGRPNFQRPMMRRHVSKCEIYVEYANHCLQLAATTADEESRWILRKMAAEWLELAEMALHN